MTVEPHWSESTPVEMVLSAKVMAVLTKCVSLRDRSAFNDDENWLLNGWPLTLDYEKKNEAQTGPESET
jgi:hypothetical protein